MAQKSPFLVPDQDVKNKVLFETVHALLPFKDDKGKLDDIARILCDEAISAMDYLEPHIPHYSAADRRIERLCFAYDYAISYLEQRHTPKTEDEDGYEALYMDDLCVDCHVYTLTQGDDNAILVQFADGEAFEKYIKDMIKDRTESYLKDCTPRAELTRAYFDAAFVMLRKSDDWVAFMAHAKVTQKYIHELYEITKKYYQAIDFITDKTPEKDDSPSLKSIN